MNLIPSTIIHFSITQPSKEAQVQTFLQQRAQACKELGMDNPRLRGQVAILREKLWNVADQRRSSIHVLTRPTLLNFSD